MNPQFCIHPQSKFLTMLFGYASCNVFISSMSNKCNVKSMFDSLEMYKHRQSLVEFPVYALWNEAQTKPNILLGFQNNFPANNEQFDMRFLVNYCFSHYNLLLLEHCGLDACFMMRQLVRGKDKLFLLYSAVTTKIVIRPKHSLQSSLSPAPVNPKSHKLTVSTGWPCVEEAFHQVPWFRQQVFMSQCIFPSEGERFHHKSWSLL